MNHTSPGNDHHLESHAADVLIDNAAFQFLLLSAGEARTARFSPVTFERGQVCLHRGETDLLFLTSGLVKATRFSQDGRALTLEVLGPGDTLGAGSLLDSAGSPEDHVVLQSGDGLRVDVPWACRLMHEQSSASIALSKDLTRRLRHAQDRAGRLKVAAASALVADWVLDFGDPPAGPSRLSQRSDFVTQDQIAEQIGIARETVNKSLRNFVLRGWLRRHRGSWVILDREAVELHAGRRRMEQDAS